MPGTVFAAVTGVGNAMNIIDGFNGLAAMCVATTLAAIARVGFQAQNLAITMCALVGLGAVLGFLVWNFPAGLTFLDDGGPTPSPFTWPPSNLPLHRNAVVLSMFPLLMCIHLIFKITFSICRRSSSSVGPQASPMAYTFQSLIYRRLIRWVVGNRSARALTRRNSMAASHLWLFCMFLVLFWDNALVLGAFIVLFAVTCVTLYGRTVCFKALDWMILRR